MGKENGNGTNGDERPTSTRPIPPPEAFRHSESFRFSPEQNNKSKANHKGQSDTEQTNHNDTFVSSAVATTTSTTAILGAQRPMIRRQSSLFGQLPVRSKSRLFDGIVTSSTGNVLSKNNGNAVANSTVAESMTNFSPSQPTWLPDDHQSTFFGGESKIDDTRSQSRNEHPTPEQEQIPGEKSSLFGAVMRQFGSSISSALPPTSPFRRSPISTVDVSLQKNSSGFGGGGGSFRGLMASPSGKTIMNIVNQFNSPFKFQSPSSSHKKRHRRRRLWKDDGDSKDNDKTRNEKERETETFCTPKKRQRMEEENDENSKPSSNILFPDHDTNGSRSSLGGDLVDEHWREAPIVSVGQTVRMEFLDWSLVTKVRIEAHGGSSEPMWIRDAIRDHDKALTYWIHQSPNVIYESTGTPQTLGLLANSSSNLSVLQKSIDTSKKSMSRQGSFSSRLDAKLANGKINSSNRKCDKNAVSSSTNHLAKHLIQSVRGPHAKYSRKFVLKESSWWDEQTTSTSTSAILRDDTREQFRRQWQQALRCLFSNFRRRVLRMNNASDSINAMVLDTYFYCIGQDHTVLFRISTGENTDSDFNTNASNGNAVPLVLVSSTSNYFRKHLESNGINLIQSSDSDDSFQLLESIQEREASERKKIITATAAAARKHKRIFNNVLLSPSVRADLEALRRAQAFGESAGADVMVKVKQKGGGADEDRKEKENNCKGIRISGWDNVSLFLEVYLNLLGETMTKEAPAENGTALPFHNSKTDNKMLPLLICPNTNDFGPFEHASLKRLSMFPAERIPEADSKSGEMKKAEKSSANHGNVMEIRGIVLPCAIRKILLVTRNRILEDEKRASASSSSNVLSSTNRIVSEPHTKSDDSDTSRYVVLHSSRPTIANSNKEPPKSWMGGINGSLIFNQGKKKKSKPKNSNENRESSKYMQNQVFECSYGNVVSMTVWDASREEVAACKLDSAFPENWIHKR